jgi:hypothetical protein
MGLSVPSTIIEGDEICIPVFEIVYPYPAFDLKTKKFYMVQDPKKISAVDETYDYFYYPTLEHE